MNCPICSKPTKHLDTIDLSTNCLGLFFTSDATPIEYVLCAHCGFCFSPTMYAWSDRHLSETVYNSEYVLVDPDFVSERPTNVFKALVNAFPDPKNIKHLDYGGGNGLLSSLLKEVGWSTQTYDPFMYDNKIIVGNKFNLITAIEVFEHCTRPQQLMKQISSLLSSTGVLLLTTLLSDGNLQKPLTWRYASPRNGHVSLFSYTSLRMLAKQYNLNLYSPSNNQHFLYKKAPSWATHLNLPG